jgi:hypothetical protein
LVDVIHVGGFARVTLGLAQGGQQKRGENRDDGHNDEQFNQSEADAPRAMVPI